MEENKIESWIKFETSNQVQIIGGNNKGRIGTITRRERHPGSFDIVHIKDAAGNMFATRLGNVFLIGSGNKLWYIYIYIYIYIFMIG